MAVGGQQLASALSYLHSDEQGLVHQDLHAGNIMVSCDGSAWKLIDMGNASPISSPQNELYLPYLR